MNCSLITVPEEEAKEKLRQYKRVLHKSADKEAESLARAYRECAKGKALIDIGEAIRAAGMGADGLPHLAIGRADRGQVCYEQQNWSDPFEGKFSSFAVGERGVPHQTYESTSLCVRVRLDSRQEKSRTAYTLVPAIPPTIVESMTADRSKYHVLFEVNKWSERPHGVRMPVDPYLLRHVFGDLYAVEAEWELTELESRIVGAIRSPGTN